LDRFDKIVSGPRCGGATLGAESKLTSPIFKFSSKNDENLPNPAKLLPIA
jgi:hypothetical protein